MPPPLCQPQENGTHTWVLPTFILGFSHSHPFQCGPCCLRHAHWEATWTPGRGSGGPNTVTPFPTQTPTGTEQQQEVECWARFGSRGPPEIEKLRNPRRWLRWGSHMPPLGPKYSRWFPFPEGYRTVNSCLLASLPPLPQPHTHAVLQAPELGVIPDPWLFPHPDTITNPVSTQLQ